MQKEFHDIVSIRNAKEILRKHYVSKRKIEEVNLENSPGRVLAEDITANLDIPPFDRASMDGYAVIASDTFYADEENPVTLNLGDSIKAGDDSRVFIKPGNCARIATGAAIPKGANAVAMVEYTGEDAGINVYRPVVPGENIMSAGSDIMRGENIIRAGTFLTSRETGVLAALGVSKLKVYKKPKVAVISTGNELVLPGENLSYGKIYDVNSRTIADSVRENGGEAFVLGIIKDDYDELYNRFREILNEDQNYDIIIASGGTSAGVGDMLYRVIDKLGKPGILVHGVAIKPGKPLIIGVVNEKPIFGLPGYPVSAIITFKVFVEELIRELAGLNPGEIKKIKANTAVRIYSSSGKHEYMPVNLVLASDGSYSLYPVTTGSGAITTLFDADGYVEILEGTEIVGENKNMDVVLLSRMLSLADLNIIGSHCIGVDIILKTLNETNKNHIQAKIINAGSGGGLSAVKRGESDISGTHLLDEEGVYNINFFEKFDIKDAVLVRGYDREQGLIVAKGNPMKILSVKDILNPDISFINRNPGSGTRTLLDIELAKLAGDGNLKEISKKINGYETIAKTHSAVASAVAYKKADVGIGIKTVARQYDLDFIPLKEEKYDFAIPKNKLEKAEVKRFLEVLRSGELKNKLKKVPGLKTNDETGKIIFEC